MYRLLHKIIKILSIFVFGLVIVSCEIINPDDPIPCYLEINELNLKTVYGQGTASHNITDAWVYVDDKPIGAFELPAKFPVIADGVHKLTIMAGIKLHGIASTRVYYPLYKPITANINFIKGEVIILDSLIDLSTTYNDNVSFAWIEDFEEGGVSIDSVLGSETRIYKTQLQAFEGDWSGKINLHDTIDSFLAKSIDKYVLPKNNTPVFLELNYKTDYPFEVGVYSNEPQGYSVRHEVLTINPKNSWNKIYINLTPTVSREVNAIDFNIYFRSILDDATNEAEIFIDNIKLVHSN
ncbi:MAG: hypothetical protein H8E98_05070 [Bacteroidetes bacterium]|nr:hypothetical protein [Bacteroidota bacterium]